MKRLDELYPQDEANRRARLPVRDPRGALRHARLPASRPGTSTRELGWERGRARESDALAVALGELGVAPGDRVAVQLQNMPQFLIALAAAWKAGAAVVPVNPMLTPRERAVLLEDSGARVLIALEALGRASARRRRT